MRSAIDAAPAEYERRVVGFFDRTLGASGVPYGLPQPASTIGLELITAVMVPLFANVLGELWGWVTGVFRRVGDVSIYWLLLALALKTAESALIARLAGRASVVRPLRE